MRRLFKNLRLWEVQALSHSESLSEKGRSIQELVPRRIRRFFWDFECRSTYFQTVFTSTSPIIREYNQTLLYGHRLNTDTSFITDWTVCFIPGEKSPYIFSEFNPLNTNTLLTLSLPVLSHSAVCFSKCYKMKFAFELGRNLPLATFGSERVNMDFF